VLAPDLEITIDEAGLTSTLADEIADALKDDKAGAEVSFAGKKTLAVRAPGSSNLFKVDAGGFRLHQVDLSIPGGRGDLAVSLDRFYSSREGSESPLGTGWSLTPLTLKIRSRTRADGFSFELARRPVLVDRRARIEMPYQLESNREAREPTYLQLSSSLQPALRPLSSGGYEAIFAHGLRAIFDSSGRLQSIDPGAGEGVTYTHSAKRLEKIEGAAGHISLSYDEEGVLFAAESSSGGRVTYEFSEGRLVSARGSEREPVSFTYDDRHRIAAIHITRDPTNPMVIARNTYDVEGRMTSQQSVHGSCTLTYDDKVGCARITGPGEGEPCYYYYDAAKRLIAYGRALGGMTLLNYDRTGRIFQMAAGELISDPTKGQRPRFRVTEMISQTTAVDR